VGIVRGKTESDAAVRESGELAEQDPDEGPVDGDGIPGSKSLGQLWLDLTGDRFLDKDEEKAGHPEIQHRGDGFGH
jgi:hypothetical protein